MTLFLLLTCQLQAFILIAVAGTSEKDPFCSYKADRRWRTCDTKHLLHAGAHATTSLKFCALFQTWDWNNVTKNIQRRYRALNSRPSSLYFTPRLSVSQMGALMGCSSLGVESRTPPTLHTPIPPCYNTLCSDFSETLHFLATYQPPTYVFTSTKL